MPIASKLLRTIEEDSDDFLENFNSSQWGDGTSKVIAQHYNTVSQAKHGREGLDGEQKLTTSEFNNLIAAMQDCRQAKKTAK